MRRLVVAVLLLQALGPAGAAVYVVDTTNDVIAADGHTSLREAVIAANTNAGLDAIHLPADRFVLTLAGAGEDAALTGDLDINDSVKIEGAGADVSIIDAAGIDRVMFINSGAAVALTGIALIGGSAGVGAGLYNQGDVQMSRCIVAYNSAVFYGGGIHNFSGALHLRDSAVFENGAGDTGGGGIDVGSGEVTLTNCTVSGNASRAGGGLFRDSGVVALDRCTVSANAATTLGGGAYDITTVANSILAGNSAGASPDVGGGCASLGFNLFGEGSSVAPLATDIVTNQAGLAALNFVQSATPVHALSNTSAAINRADPATATNAVANDQRGPGFPRVRGLRADIGAFEHQNPDEDRDGLPDEWEAAFGLAPTNSADAGLDPDLDTFVNADEYIADTIPTNGLSYPRVSSVLRTGELWLVEVPSSTACIYRLQGAAAGPAGAWTGAWGSVSGQPGWTTLVATDPAPALLRVTIERPVP